PRSLSLVVAILGITKAGGAYVPLDPALPAESMACMLHDSGAKMLVTDRGASCAAALRPETTGDVALVFFEEIAEKEASFRDQERASSGVTPANLACVMYTSGARGQLWGVLVTHGNVTRLFDSTAHWYGFGRADVFTLFHSYAVDFSVWELWG